MKKMALLSGILAILLIAFTFNCGESIGKKCIDIDGDGYGEHCSPGPDCDETTPAHWSDCGICEDGDGDDYGDNCDLGPDCNDSNSNINPGAEEIAFNEVDDNCDGNYHPDLIRVGHRDTSGYSQGVYVTGDYAYVATARFGMGVIYDGGLAIIDVGEPANPGTPIFEATPWGIGGVYVTGGYAYLAGFILDVGFICDDGGLAIIDVSDPANPGTPIYRDTSGLSYGVYVTGGYAYVADWESGLAIIDVSNPANPGTPLYRDTSGPCKGVYVTGGYAYVADYDSGLAIIDVSDPTNPGTPVYRDTSGQSGGVYVTGGYAYVADDISSLAIIDVSNPANPGTPVYRDTSGASYGVYVTGSYVYVADGASGLEIFRIW